jgi:hypothetical protein
VTWTENDWTVHVHTYGHAPQLPCDRCTQVRHLFPHRPGELLCKPCRTGARNADRHERNHR